MVVMHRKRAAVIAQQQQHGPTHPSTDNRVVLHNNTTKPQPPELHKQHPNRIKSTQQQKHNSTTTCTDCKNYCHDALLWLGRFCFYSTFLFVRKCIATRRRPQVFVLMTVGILGLIFGLFSVTKIPFLVLDHIQTNYYNNRIVILIQDVLFDYYHPNKYHPIDDDNNNDTNGDDDNSHHNNPNKKKLYTNKYRRDRMDNINTTSSSSLDSTSYIYTKIRYITIFYNIYIPHDRLGIKNAISIIREQIVQIGNSDLLLLLVDGIDNESIPTSTTNTTTNTKSKTKYMVRLLYNSIGNSKPIPNGQIEKWCRKAHSQLQCQRIAPNYKIADESITLQSIYDYCHEKLPIPLQHHPDDPYYHNSNHSSSSNNTVTIDSDTVVYLHSKGSYHNNEVNDAWRRSLTAAALHEHCFEPPPPSNEDHHDQQTCNVCGLQFYTLFTLFVPGNMWTSTCHYIRQLVPPLNSIPLLETPTTTMTVEPVVGNESAPVGRLVYKHLREQVVEQLGTLRARGYINNTLLRERKDYYGLDRYNTEHWIGSHPYVHPCDLDPIGSLKVLFHKSKSMWRKVHSIYIGQTKRNNRRTSILKQQQQQFQQTQRNIRTRSHQQIENGIPIPLPTIPTTTTTSSRNTTRRDTDGIGGMVVVDEYGFSYSPRPRHNGFVVAENKDAKQRLLNDERIRYKEYYYLPGHLLKWSLLYNTDSDNTNHTTMIVPSNDSWIWDWFPDGDYWKNGIHQYGIHNVITKLNHKYAFRIEGMMEEDNETIMDRTVRSSAFVTTTARSRSSSAAAETTATTCGTTGTNRNEDANNVTFLDAHTDPEYIVFYHIALLMPQSLSTIWTTTTTATTNKEEEEDDTPTNNKNDPRKDEENNNNQEMFQKLNERFELIQKQFEIISVSYQKLQQHQQQQEQNKMNVTVFYTIVTNVHWDHDPHRNTTSDRDMVDDNNKTTTTCEETSQSHIIPTFIKDQVYTICTQYTNINCRLLTIVSSSSVNNDYEGETLEQMHRFCKNNNNTTNNKKKNDPILSYINNQGPIQLRNNNNGKQNVTNLLLHMTLAATNLLCIQGVQQQQNQKQQQQPHKDNDPNHTCNVCGLIFYTIWTLFFPGNMVCTKCSYVRQLVSPIEYEHQMNAMVIPKLFLTKVRTNIIMSSLLPHTYLRPDYIGLDHYSIAYWISSHPNLVPCDVTSFQHDLSTWNRINITTNASHYEVLYLYAPLQQQQQEEDQQHNHHNDGTMIITHHNYNHYDDNNRMNVPSLLVSSKHKPILSMQTKHTVDQNDGLRIREYYYLSGHLLKWYGLYRTLPHPTSWIWNYFPDGTLWYNATRTLLVPQSDQQQQPNPQYDQSRDDHHHHHHGASIEDMLAIIETVTSPYLTEAI